MSQINVNTIKDKSGLGAPSFPNGVNATGVITATSFSGDGGNLTGIDASSLRVGGATKVQATSTGLVITGIATASNFKTGSTNVHSVGVEAAGINVLGGDTPIGAGSTIYDNGNASFNGNVTSDGNITAAGNVTAAGNINANGNIVGDNSTNITGINDATFAGNVSVGGTLTYEDVSNIDSVGLITARSGVNISDTTESTSTTTGSLKVAGGVGIVKNLHVGGTSQFKDVTIPSANKISTSANNLIIDSASGTVVVSNNFATNGSNTLGSALQNNTTYINSTTAAHSNANTLVVGHGSGNYAGMTFQCAAAYPGGIYFTDTDNGQQGGIAYYHNGDQLRFIAGETQYMSIDSSAITANNSVPFVGNLTGNVTGNTSGSSGSCTGNALTATTLQNARTIAGVSFNGSANISLNNNAITNGAGYITASGTAALATSVTVTANNGNNENVYLAFVDSASGGTQGIETDASLTYNPSTNTLTTTEFVGGLTGNASGTSGGFTAGNASNLNSGTVASARLGSSGTRSSSTYLRGDNTWADDGCFIRADAADTASGDITFSGGGGAITIAANSDIQFASGTWTGEVAGKIQHNSNKLYIQGGSNGIQFRSHNGSGWGGWNIDGSTGHLTPANDSACNIGSNSVRVANIYADYYYGDGSNLTGLPTLSGSNTFSNSYNEFGDGHGSVSNDGNWNARINVAGSTHARLDVKSVSDGIIMSMSSHTGHAKGYIGTRSSHALGFYSGNAERATLSTSGAFSVIDSITAATTVNDSNGELRKVSNYNAATNGQLSQDSGRCALSTGNGLYIQARSAGYIQSIINDKGTQISLLVSGVNLYNTADGTLSTASNGVVFKMGGRGMATFYWKDSTTVYMSGTQITT